MGAKAIPFIVVPLALVYKVTALPIVRSAFQPDVSINCITLLAAFVPSPAVTYKTAPLAFLAAQRPTPPKPVV